MASKFILTSEIRFTTNQQSIDRVRQQVIKGLNGKLLREIDVRIDPTSLARAKAQVNSLNTTLAATGKTAQDTTQIASKGFLDLGASLARTITLGAALFGVFSQLRTAAHDAQEFSKSIVQVGQVTNTTGGQLKGIQTYLENLTTTYGVAGASIAQAFKKVVSANIPLSDTREIIEGLSKQSLTASFQDMDKSTESAIGLFHAFNLTGKQTVDVLNQLVATSEHFGAETADYNATISKDGAIFKAIGGNATELISIFTAVRQGTRLSADDIATGLKTIFARMSDARIEAQLFAKTGVHLRDSLGNIKPPLRAINEIRESLAGQDPRGQAFADTAILLGGSRNLSKTIPLIQQAAVAQQIYKEALAASGNVDSEVAAKLDTLNQKFTILHQKVVQTFTRLSENRALRSTADVFIQMADSTKSLVEQLNRLVDIKVSPALLSLAALGGGAALAFGGAKAGGARGFGAGLLGLGLAGAGAKALAPSKIGGIPSDALIDNLLLGLGGQHAITNGLQPLVRSGLGRTGLFKPSTSDRLTGNVGRLGTGLLVGSLIGNATADASPAVSAHGQLAGGIIGGGIAGSAFGPVGAIAGAVGGGALAVPSAINSIIQKAHERRFSGVTSELGVGLDNLTTGRDDLSPARITGLKNQVVKGFGEANTEAERSQIRATLPAWEGLRDKLVSTSHTLQEFNDKGGRAAIEAAAHITGIPFAKLQAAVEKQIEANNRQAFSAKIAADDFTRLAALGVAAHQDTEATHNRLFTKNAGSSLDFARLDFSSSISPEAGAVKGIQQQLPHIAQLALANVGNAKDFVSKNLPAGIATNLNEYLDHFANVGRPDELLSGLHGVLAPHVQANAQANGQLHAALSARQTEFEAATHANLAADAAQVATGDSSVSRSIFGRERSVADIGGSIAASRRALVGVQGQLSQTTDPQLAGNLQTERQRLVDSIMRESHALDLMATSTAQVTKLQNEANLLHAQNAGNLSAGLIKTFGSPEQQAELQRNENTSGLLASGALDIGSLSPQQRQEQLSYLQSYGTSGSFGPNKLSGGQLIGQLVQQTTGDNTSLQIATKERQILDLESQRVGIINQQVLGMKSLLAQLEAGIAGKGVPLAATGGLTDYSKLAGIANQFADFGKLIGNLKGLQVDLQFRGSLEVILNGATVLQNIMPEVRQVVENHVKLKLNDYISNQLPQLRKIS